MTQQEKIDFLSDNFRPDQLGFDCGCTHGFIATQGFATQICKECSRGFSHHNGQKVGLCNQCSFNHKQCQYCKKDLSGIMNELNLKVNAKDLIRIPPGYFGFSSSDITGDYELTIEPLTFGKFAVGKYYLSEKLIGEKITCDSFAEALLKLNELI